MSENVEPVKQSLCKALGLAPTTSFTLDELVAGVIRNRDDARADRDLQLKRILALEEEIGFARTTLIDALGEETMEWSLAGLAKWSLAGLAKWITKDRDDWQRIALERKAALEDDTETNKATATSLRRLVQEQEETIRDLNKEIAHLQDCAASVPAVLNSTLIKETETLRERNTALTQVAQVLTRLGIPRLASEDGEPRLLAQHERVARLGIEWNNARMRADRAEASVAGLLAGDDFEKRVEKMGEQATWEDEVKVERIVWTRKYAKARANGLDVEQSIAYARKHVALWREGMREFRIESAAPVCEVAADIREAENTVLVSSLQKQVEELQAKVTAAESCAQESADIMRRARDRAERATKHLEKARVIAERVVRWYDRVRVGLASEPREILLLSEGLIEQLNREKGTTDV